MLTAQEINNIFSWLPYRDSWSVDRNKVDDNIESYYGDLINELSNNNLFQTYYSQNGGLSNYLEFICYPNGLEYYDDNAIVVYVNLCAPLATYGQIRFTKSTKYLAWGFIEPETIGLVTDTKLAEIEKEVFRIIKSYNLNLLDKEFACKPLPNSVVEKLKGENHNEGTQYLHGLFQVTD